MLVLMTNKRYPWGVELFEVECGCNHNGGGSLAFGPGKWKCENNAGV